MGWGEGKDLSNRVSIFQTHCSRGDTKLKQRTLINFNHRLLRLIKIKIRLFVRCKAGWVAGEREGVGIYYIE